MKKTLTALLCSLFLLAPCSVAQTFTFETGRGGTGIVFGTDGYTSGVGVDTPCFHATYSNGYYDNYGRWHPCKKCHKKHNKSKKYYKKAREAQRRHEKAVRKARKEYYKEMRKAYRDRYDD